ncbi:MAG: cyanophycinase [Actinomycetes bacterium]
MPTPAAPPETPGPLLVIGGAEDKVGTSRVLRRFVRTAGGRRARIALVPTASSVEPEMVEVYTRVLTDLGAGRVDAVAPGSRAEADDPALAAVVGQSSGVFLTGGSQLKLAQIVTGTALGTAVLAAHRRGAVVAGTSAGASIMSRHMISLGGHGVTPRQRSSQLTAGLGLLDDVVVDQHFDQRTRHGRLLSVVATSPSLLGMGVDEDTAALVTERRWLEVVGSGSVFLVDARSATSDAHEARAGAPLLLSGAVVHTLPAGARFDLERRVLVSFTERHPDRAITGATAEPDEVRALAARLRAQLHRSEDLEEVETRD